MRSKVDSKDQNKKNSKDHLALMVFLGVLMFMDLKKSKVCMGSQANKVIMVLEQVLKSISRRKKKGY